MASIGNRHYVYVDSHNKTSGTHSNFKYSLFYPQDQDFDRVVVLNAIIPKSFYLIQTGSTFVLTESTSVTITPTPGNYLLGTFCTVMSALLTANSPGHFTYVVSYPNINTAPNTGKFTYTVTGNGSVQPSFTFTNTLYEQFGFEPSTTNTFAGSSLTSTNVVKLQAEDRLLLCSDIMESYFKDNVLQDINSSSSPDFSTINYQNVAPEFTSKKLLSKNNSTVSFSLTNEDYIEQNLNGLNIVFTLCIFKESAIYERIEKFLKWFSQKDAVKEEQKNQPIEEQKSITNNGG